MKNKFPWVVLVAIHVAFFIYAMHGGNTQLKDSSEYLQQSQNLQTNSSWYCGDYRLPFKEELVSQRPPLYGALLACMQIPTASNVLLFLVQSILSIFNYWLAYRILFLLTNKKINSGLFLLPVLFFPTQFIYSNMIMSEMVFQTFLICTVYFGIFYLKNGKINHLWLFQLMMTLSFLVKPFTVLLPVFTFPFILFYLLKEKKSLLPLASFILPVGIILAIMQFNYSKTGVREYSSISRKLMINYNVYALSEKLNGATVAFNEIDSVEKTASLVGYPQRVAMIDKFCLNKIFEHPVIYLSLHLYGTWLFFIDPCTWEINHFFNYESVSKDIITSEKQVEKKLGMYFFRGKTFHSASYIILCVLLNLFLLLSFLVSVLSKNTEVKYRILLTMFVCYFALFTGPSASSRFRLPVFPLLLITYGILINKINENASAEINSHD